MAGQAKHESDMVCSHIHKQARGEPTSRDEQRAYRRFTEGVRNDAIEAYLRAMPKGHYRKLAGGRQTKSLHDDSRRYGVPVRETKVDLYKVIDFFHQLLSDQGFRLLTDETGDPMLGGPNSPALEKCRHEKWLILQMERRQKEGQLVPTDVLAACHSKMSSVLRNCGEQLERRFGTDAADVLRDGLDAVEAAIEDLLDNYESQGESNGEDSNVSQAKAG